VSSNVSGQLFIGKFNTVIADLDSNGQTELAEALKTLEEAVMASAVLLDDEKQEQVEVINHIGEEEARLQAAHERVLQRANEGQSLPRSMGVPRAGARRPQSLGEPTPEPALLLTQGRLEAWKDRSVPPVL